MHQMIFLIFLGVDFSLRMEIDFGSLPQTM